MMDSSASAMVCCERQCGSGVDDGEAMAAVKNADAQLTFKKMRRFFIARDVSMMIGTPIRRAARAVRSQFYS